MQFHSSHLAKLFALLSLPAFLSCLVQAASDVSITAAETSVGNFSGSNSNLPSSGLLPAITKAPGSNNLLFSYKRKIAASGVTQVIEHATSVSPPWTSAVHGQNGVTIITSPLDAETEQVTATIPSTSTSRFVRLKVVR